tara:strand:+ start:284 stop:598 length:315 start_codon:yes stop_codon:yes gene_type:complete
MPVIEKNDKDFKEFVEVNKKVMIKFYADWCGNCRLFAPKFERMSNSSDLDIAFVKINAELNPEIRKMVGVDNLPYFAAINNMKIVDKDCTSKEERVQEMIDKLS